MRQNISNGTITKEAAETAMVEYQTNSNNQAALELICMFAEQCCKKSLYLKRIPVDDREDVSQNVVVRTIEQIDRYDSKRNETGNGTSVQAWINQMIYTICNDELRKKTSRVGGKRAAREVCSLDNDKYTESLSYEGWNITSDSGCHTVVSVNALTCGIIAGPEETLYKKYERAALEAAFIHLPERYAEVIDMYYYKGLSVKEITQKIRSTETAVKKVMDRARRKIRQYLLNYDFEVA